MNRIGTSAVGQSPHLALRVFLSLRERSEVREQSSEEVTSLATRGVVVAFKIN